MGAALASYTVFSVAPILIIAISAFGIVIGADTIRADLLPQMQNLSCDADASAMQCSQVDISEHDVPLHFKEA
jgi:membrane protein